MLTGACEAPGWRAGPQGCISSLGSAVGAAVASPPAPAALAVASCLPAIRPTGLALLWAFGALLLLEPPVKRKMRPGREEPSTLPVTMHVAVGREGKREIAFPSSLVFHRGRSKGQREEVRCPGSHSEAGQGRQGRQPPDSTILRLTSGWGWPVWEGLLGPGSWKKFVRLPCCPGGCPWAGEG